MASTTRGICTRDFFLSEVSGRTTEGFLTNPTAVEAVAPLCRQHAASEARRLQAEFRLGDLNTLRTRVRRVLITTIQLAGHSGSELWTEEFARYLIAYGFDVLIYAGRLGEVADIARSRGSAVTDNPEEAIRFDPDLVHINHYDHAPEVISGIKPGTPVVNMIHGLIPAPGMPGIDKVSTYCSVGLHAKAKTVMVSGHPWESVDLIPSFYDPVRFPDFLPQANRRALLFSSKTDPEQRERLREILAKLGYSLDHVGYGGIPSGNPAEIMKDYELVFGVARSAVEALAAGKHVILWDAGLIGPIVTEDQFWPLCAANFSMASCVVPYTHALADEAESWIADQISRVPSVARAREFARDKLSIEKVGPRLLAVLDQACRVESGARANND